MDIKLIDKLFNDFLWKMEMVEHVDETTKNKMLLAFRQGVIEAQKYLIDNFIPTNTKKEK